MSDDDRRPVSTGQGAPPPPRRGSGSATDPAPPAPRRRERNAEPVVVQPTVAAPVSAGAAGKPPKTPKPSKPGGAQARPAKARTQLPWPFRVLAWVIAIPLGLALVGIPARKAGYLSSQKLLDIVIERNLDRYLPLAVIVILWALVTALLVQVLVEGGGWLMRRREERRAQPVPNT
jgi:hypothetical protein